MAHSYVEIANDSREFDVTNSGISQTLKVVILLDPEDELPIEHANPDYDFLSYSDDVVALEYAYSIIPEFRYCPNYDLEKKVLVLENIKLKQEGPRQWMVDASYTFNINQGSGGSRPEEGKNTLPFVKLNFNIGGGTKRVMKSRVVSDVAVREDAPIAESLELSTYAWKGAIGITDDSIEGTDVPSSDLRVQITVYYLPAFITFDFMKLIRDTIAGISNKGSYNDAEYLDCEEGEVQLRGASGGGVVVDIVPITFDFHIGKNIEDVEDEGFSNLTMKAHDVLDYLFLKEWDPDVKKMLINPALRVVHEVADPMDYSVLELPLNNA